ncbi:Zinc finger protein 76, partial [Globisporangium polare]
MSTSFVPFAVNSRAPGATTSVYTNSNMTGATNPDHRFREPSQDRPFLCPFPSCAGRFHR